MELEGWTRRIKQRRKTIDGVGGEFEIKARTYMEVEEVGLVALTRLDPQIHGVGGVWQSVKSARGYPLMESEDLWACYN